MRRGKPVIGPSRQSARPRSVTADPQIVAAEFRDGSTPFPGYRSFKAIIRFGSMLCRKTWRIAPRRTTCARFVTLISLNCRASCGPRGLDVIEVLHDVMDDRLAPGLAIDN